MIPNVNSGDSGKLMSQEFDLNLAPIIDCFTVLIAFVMISTAFASIGVLDAGVAAGGKTHNGAAEPEVRLSVNLKTDGDILLHLSGKESREVTIAALAGGSRDTPGLIQQLTDIKTRWPTLTQARVAAANDVAYQDVVSSIEAIRKTVPGIALDGF